MMFRMFGILLFLVSTSLLPVWGQTTASSENGKPRYGDPGYTGVPIDFHCKLCLIPNLLQGLAVSGGIQTEFPESDKWLKVAESVDVVGQPWNIPFDAILQRYQLQAEWTPKGKLLISSRGKAILTPTRILADLFNQLPPIPENTVSLSGSARAVQGDRFFREGIGSFSLSNDNDTRIALVRFAWATQLFENVDYRSRQASALNYLGLCYLDLDRPAEARRAFAQSLEIAKLVGNQRAETLAELCLTRLSILEGKPPENAEALADEASKFVRDLNSRNNLSKPSLLDKAVEAMISTQAGRVLYLLGKYDKASAALLVGFFLARTLEDLERVQVEALVFLERSSVRATRRADAQQATEFLRGVEKKVSSPRLRVSLKSWTGSLYGQCGEYTRAIDWLQEALAGLRLSSDTGLEIAVNREMGRMYAGLKKYTEARRFLDAALKLAEQNGEDAWKTILRDELKQLP